MKRKVTILALIAVLCALAVGAWIFHDPAPLVRHVINRVVAARAAASEVPETRFEVLFISTDSPNSTPSRGQPCVAVIVKGKLFLFDAGEGSVGALSEFHAPTAKLDTIFLTHLHSDHMSGVREVLHNTWLYGRTEPVDIVGPPGTVSVIDGFSSVYALDTHERQRVLGAENIDPKSAMGSARDFTYTGVGPEVVYDKAGVVIEAFRVDHPDWPDAYGYRVSYRDKTVVISGDTKKADSVAKMAVGADLLIHEALIADAMNAVADALTRHDIGVNTDRMELIAAVHTTTIEVAEIARDADVGHVALTHLIPALPPNAFTDRYFTRGWAKSSKAQSQ